MPNKTGSQPDPARRQVALHNIVRLAVYRQPKASGSVWPCPAMRSKSKGKQRRKARVYLGSPSGLQSIHLTPRLRFRLKCLLSLQSSCLLSFLFVLHLSAVCYFIHPPQPQCLTAFKVKQSPSPSCQSSTLGKGQASVLFAGASHAALQNSGRPPPTRYLELWALPTCLLLSLAALFSIHPSIFCDSSFSPFHPWFLYLSSSHSLHNS